MAGALVILVWASELTGGCIDCMLDEWISPEEDTCFSSFSNMLLRFFPYD